jgi:Mn-dependent DtxR family transcriptional regulator
MSLIITEVQKTVLKKMLHEGRSYAPRSSLERLQKKGLVEGDRREGWVLTRKGVLVAKE